MTTLRFAKGLFTVIVAIVAVILVVNALKNPDNPGDAYEAAKSMQQERMLTPWSAEFPGISEATIEKRVSTWDNLPYYEIESYVDAQNAFGVKVRNRWRMTVRREGGRWVVPKTSATWEDIYERKYMGR